MERQRPHENDRQRNTSDAPPDGDGLAQQRGEIDDLLRASDHAFDAINNLHAQEYLVQNVQTGGQ